MPRQHLGVNMAFKWNGIRATAGAVALAMVLAIGAPAQAATNFSGDMALPTWSTTNFGAGDGSVNVSPSEVITLTSSNNGHSGQTEFSHFISDYTGSLSFDWSYSSADNDSMYDPAYYFQNIGGISNLVYLENSGALSSSGTATLNLVRGDTFGWGIASLDGCCGAGQLSINNVSYAPRAPAPLVGSGLLSALAALLGLGATRLGRRKLVLG